MEDNLYQSFLGVCREQAEKHGRNLSDFDRKVAHAVYVGASLARQDQEENNTDRNFRVVTAPTGSGKTCSTVAYITAAFRVLPKFTCAYVVDTIRQADEVGRMLIDLLGETPVTVWTSGHKANLSEYEIADIEAQYGHLSCPKSHREELLKSPIVVVTHATWKNEMTKGMNLGVTTYKDKKREIVFVDEDPDLVRLIEITPADIMTLRDRVLATEKHPELTRALTSVFRRAEQDFTQSGQTYATTKLVTDEEAQVIRAYPSVSPFVSNRLKTSEANRRKKEMQHTMSFLNSAASGCVFMSRQAPRSLVSYTLDFKPGPGHVLLDATADLSGMVAFLPGMETVEVPQVSYENLEIVHIDQPSEFKDLKTVTKSARKAKPYGKWILDTVRENTQEGDRVLLVTHKDMIDHEYIPEAYSDAVNLDGRLVHTLHFGLGIGSNHYKECTHVFIFGEFFIPKKVAISGYHGFSDTRPSDQELKHHYSHEGYLTAYEGHLLRWTKQLACRGNVRNATQEGQCGRMKLVLTMDKKRLLKGLREMFPGAPTPIQGVSRHSPKLNRVQSLCRILADPSTEDTLSTKDVEKQTSIKGGLRKAVSESPELALTMETYGWLLKTGKDLGLSGKGMYLSRVSE